MPEPATPAARPERLGLVAAPAFVLLWSTGFIGAKLGLPHIEPLTFLAIRFWIVAVCFALWVWGSGARLPSAREALDALYELKGLLGE